jgi:hypothetical protein
MARIPLTVIAKEDFPAIRQLCAGRIAENTHGAWEWQRDRNHRDEVASGHELVPTQITPVELRDYCRKHNRQADETAIRLLTEEKFMEAERRRV